MHKKLLRSSWLALASMAGLTACGPAPLHISDAGLDPSCVTCTDAGPANNNGNDAGVTTSDAGEPASDAGSVTSSDAGTVTSSDAGPIAPGGTDAGPAPTCPGCWRSTLYPTNWTPDFTDSSGHFLHDFSYAGYHNGEVPLPETMAGVSVSVVDHGADNTGAHDATAAIQATVDAVATAGGGVVFFPAGTYRVDGIVRVTHSNILLQGVSTTSSKIFFTKDSGMTDRANIEFHGAITQGADVPLTSDGHSRSFTVDVANAGNLAVGDDVAVGFVITDAFIADHNMTGTWAISNGQWRPFFRRKIVAIDVASGHTRLTFDVPLRTELLLRDSASVRKETGAISECGIAHLGLANAVGWDQAWANDRAHVISFTDVKDCWANDLASFTPPGDHNGTYDLQSGGSLVYGGKRVTIQNVTWQRAQNRGNNGNGYLFEIMSSNEVLTKDCVGHDGRHNFIQNWDFGTTGCVWLRPDSAGGKNFQSKTQTFAPTAYSEYHHSLALANLVDSANSTDGWQANNRRNESSGAGLSSTEDVFWNMHGGVINSFQFGFGYVIGTTSVSVTTSLSSILALFDGAGSAPEDFVEGKDEGSTLDPPSLYEDQLRRRLHR